MGTKLIVALNSDESIRALKGTIESVHRPFNPQSQRKAVLEALRCVDEVRVFDGLNAIDLIKEIKPDILTCGYGYTLDKIIGREIVLEYGGRVAITSVDDARNECNELSTTKVIRKMRMADILETCRAASSYSCLTIEKLHILAQQYLSVKDLEGDVVDLGSCRGGSALVLRKLSQGKRLHLFDTWEGTPYDDPLCHHKKGEWKADIGECQALVGNDKETFYWEGVFPESFPQTGDRPFCFAFVDMDTYQSTGDAIAYFWPRLVVGGKMVFDDYNWEPCTGVKKAVDEIFSSNSGVCRKLLTVGHICIVEKL
jgi:glycerol-3-phosphate cytidylyltransferase-like family protein